MASGWESGAKYSITGQLYAVFGRLVGLFTGAVMNQNGKIYYVEIPLRDI